MKFTQYLREQTRPERKASFIDIVKHDPLWPAESNRLEDFEVFLLSQLDEEGDKLIPELRNLWRDYAHQVGRTEGKHDLDLAMAAWADYAHHRKECTGSPEDPCCTEEDLFEAAMEVSGFDDLLERSALPCGGADDDEVEELDELFERGLGSGDGDEEDEEAEDDDEEWDEQGEWEPSPSEEHEAR